LTVSRHVKKTGNREGEEVRQVLSSRLKTRLAPGARMKGLQKIRLQPGEKRKTSTSRSRTKASPTGNPKTKALGW